MRNCPKCSTFVDGTTCQECGYSDIAKVQTVGYPDKWTCANIERGMRCADGARFFPGTRGDGPGYCWTHANFVHGGHPELGRPMPPPAGTFARLAELTKRVAPVKAVDFEAVAERAAIQAESDA